MKSIYKYISVLIIASQPLLLCLPALTGPKESENTLVLTHVNILPMTGELILEDYSLLIKNGKIADLAPASAFSIPGEVQVMEGEGRYLIPALSDMHIHLEGQAWNIMYPPGEGYEAGELNYEDILFNYLAHGITTVQLMSAFPEHVVLRDRINRDELAGPRLILSRMIDGAGKAWPPPISTWINESNEARAAVLEAHHTGYDRIKVYSFLDRASYDTILLTAAELNMPVDGHIPIALSPEYCVRSGQRMIAHSEEFLSFAGDYSKSTMESFSSTLIEGDVWLTPTLVTSHNLNRLLEDPELQFSKEGAKYLHPMGADLGQYIYENLYKPIPDSRRQYLKVAYETFQVPFVHIHQAAGGKMLSGSDVLIPPNLPGYALHQELEELVSAGLSPYEALLTSTTNPHEYLNEIEYAGTIEPGKIANLLLLGSNPFEDISNTRKIEALIFKGRLISKAEIDSRLAKIAASNNSLSKSKKTSHEN